jgi:hypothetical protein
MISCMFTFLFSFPSIVFLSFSFAFLRENYLSVVSVHPATERSRARPSLQRRKMGVKSCQSSSANKSIRSIERERERERERESRKSRVFFFSGSRKRQILVDEEL